MNYHVTVQALPPGGTSRVPWRITSARRFATGALDSLPHAKWMPGVKAGYYLSREMFGGRSAGGSRMGNAEITVHNPHGGFDYLEAEGWRLDGGEVEVLGLDEGGAYADAVRRLTGVVQRAAFDMDTITLRLLDYQTRLDKPLNIPKYQGTNSGADGIEGTADDIKGKHKPFAYGYCRNVTPVCVNRTSNIYQAHFRRAQDYPAVYSSAGALTRKAAPSDYADEVALKAALDSMPAGQYATCLAKGLFGVKTTLETEITCDVLGDAENGYAADVAGAFRVLLDLAGWPPSMIDEDSLAALAAACPQVIHLYDPDGSKGRDLMDEAAAAVWAWYCPSLLGVLRFGRVEEPTGEPYMDLRPSFAVNLRRVENDLAGAPWPLVSMKWGRNYTPMTGLTLASLTADPDRKAWLEQEWRTVHSSDDGEPDPDLAASYPWASAEEFTANLAYESDAKAETLRRFNYRKNVRGGYIAEIHRTPGPGPRPYWEQQLDGLDIGHVVRLFHHRFGLAGGRKCYVSGIRNVEEENYMEVTLNG